MKKSKNSKAADSIKSFIINYISLKIINNEFKYNDRIPSENLFADKFACSRLTARSAILVLVHLGVLNAVKGSGHYVSNDAIKILLPTFYLTKKSTDVVTKASKKKDESKYFFISRYYTKEKNHAIVYWTIDKVLYDQVLKNYANETTDCSLQLISAGVLGIKVVESLVKINGEIYIKHTHYNENNNFLFEFNLWCDEMEEISTKTFLKL